MRRFSMIYLRLIALAILSISFSNIVKAQFLFSPSNFTVVDRTKVQNNWGGSFVTNVGGNANRYRLTDTFYVQTMAMWHNQQIDLSKDFTFSFKLSFGNGRIYSAGIADGIVFVMTRQSISNALIGEGEWDIGYGGIGNSLACEFDTEWNGNSTEGSNNSIIYHTSFLKNGIMSGINGVHQIQNDIASVKGKELCATVVWRRTNEINGTDGYDLTVYTQELGNNSQNGEMVERNTAHFATLSDAVSGLTLDANGKALVNWGITSATCNDPNRHEIEFISMVSENIMLRPYNVSIGGLEGTPTDIFNITNSYIETGCGTILPPNYTNSGMTENDPIKYKHTLCYPSAMSNLQIKVLDGINTKNAMWYVKNDSLWTHIEYGDNNETLVLNELISNYRSKNRIDTLLIMLGIPGVDTLYFEIPYYNNILNDYFSDTTNLPQNMEFDGGLLNLQIDTNSREQSIILPNIIGYEYKLGQLVGENSYELDTNKYLDLPKIISDSILHFKLKEDVCNASMAVPIHLTCECGDDATLVIIAPACEDTTDTEDTAVCNDCLEFVDLGNCVQYITGKKFGPDINCIDVRVKPHCVDSSGNLLTILSSYSKDSASGNIEQGYNDGSLSLSSPCNTTMTFYTYATLSDGSTCCDTFSYFYKCTSPDPGDLFTNADILDDLDNLNNAVALYELSPEDTKPLLPSKLYIDLYDNMGNFLMPIHNAMITSSNQLSGSVLFNTNNLISGIYYVKFKFANAIVTVPFIKK